MSQLAVAWVLQNPNVSAAIVGATRPEQVRENVKASGVALEQGLLKRDRRDTRPGHRDQPRADQEPGRPLAPSRRRPGSVLRMQAHRAVFAPAVLQQADLIDTGVREVTPVLAQPCLRIALAAEALLRQAT